jgi:hypothetical protein
VAGTPSLACTFDIETLQAETTHVATQPNLSRGSPSLLPFRPHLASITVDGCKGSIRSDEFLSKFGALQNFEA